MRVLLATAAGALALLGAIALTLAPTPLPAPLELDDAATSASPAGMAFSQAVVIDELRAGGEPVIGMTPAGTLLISSHPGWTHVHPSDDPLHAPSELLLPANGQSYLWRSTDGGATWEHIGFPLAQGLGPRGTGLGVSDPDFVILPDGRAFFTDLEGLASASVSRSEDDGSTWLVGNPVASEGAVDRQWLAGFGGSIYFTANYLAPPGRHVSRSDDGGLTWTRLGRTNCGGDFVADPRDGTLYAGCGPGVSVSVDGGRTWARRNVPGHSGGGLQEPAVDGAGNVWVAWTSGSGSRLWLAGSPDKGLTWPWVHELTGEVRDLFGGSPALSHVWPWPSAGSAGRVALTVYATPTSGAPNGGALDRPWSVVSVAVFQADGASPDALAYLLKDTHHRGPICLSGTSCQINSLQGSPQSDRRMGDFFEATIGHDGFLYVAYSDTTLKPLDIVSHTGFVRQTGGPRFVVDATVPTQG